MARELIVERNGHLLLRRDQGRALVAGAAVYGVMGTCFAVTGSPAVPAIGCIAVGGILAAVALWRRARRDEISVEAGELEVTRYVGPICLGRDRVTPGELRLIDHEARPDAMFSVVAMTGPGYLQVRRADGPPVTIARGLGYDGAKLQALMAQIQGLLSHVTS